MLKWERRAHCISSTYESLGPPRQHLMYSRVSRSLLTSTNNTAAAMEQLLLQLGHEFFSAPQDSTFACGGSIPIAVQLDSAPGSPSSQNVPDASSSGSTPKSCPDSAPDSTSSSQDVQTRLSPPITLRWDPQNSSTPASQCRITFPIEDGQQEILTGLLRDMQPATFGFQGKDIYDESYRKASKLDTSQFSSTFNPYELGIVDAVAQLLLPNLQLGGKASALKRGVRAELYKLNVYSSPSGQFHTHVDTPRSVDQFGSLVVCLPVAHTGGQLKVQHLGKDIVFDWSTTNDSTEKEPAIQWAAFYSDCRHEVLEVTSGHRITLTYNLYATYGGGAITGLNTVIDMTQLPLYKILSSLKEFRPKDELIGIYTNFAYPHTSDESCLPYALKGLDMAVWEILGHLGYERELLPVAEHNGERFVGGSLEWRQVDEEIEDESAMLSDWILNYKGRALEADEVFWLNKPCFGNYEKPQISYVAYGNEASLGLIYSTCAIIAAVHWNDNESDDNNENDGSL
ncbi:hypothetical protein F5Y07DRAFT_384517 [Xylaria sp. FL0933]|nr:hypothetical protein F5Y07DRAFT_384517 [Xylaria sp. FL0933]